MTAIARRKLRYIRTFLYQGADGNLYKMSDKVVCVAVTAEAFGFRVLRNGRFDKFSPDYRTRKGDIFFINKMQFPVTSQAPCFEGAIVIEAVTFEPYNPYYGPKRSTSATR